MKCYYHNDADGRCAGAIVNRFYTLRKMCVPSSYVEVDYKDDIDVGQIEKDEEVVVVDFSLKPRVMNGILQITRHIIWIDHHRTAFEYEKDYNRSIAGVRDNNFSGCELAWNHFFHNEIMPACVALIGDRDKWAWKLGNTAAFNQGLYLYPHHPTDSVWKHLLDETSDDHFMTKQIIGEGEVCLRYRDSFCKDYADSYGFETKFEGYKAFALGIYMFGSEAFGRRFEKYPMCLSFAYLGNKWVVGLYSEAIDVSRIAKRYGGGGHKGAAGFVCDELPFESV